VMLREKNIAALRDLNNRALTPSNAVSEKKEGLQSGRSKQ